jgi:hypothetical protein
MGEISWSASFLLLIVLLVTVIAIFPENLCIPFTTICVFLEPLHYLKNLLFYFGSVFFYFAILASFAIGIIRAIKFFRNNPIILHLLNFITTFDEKSYRKLKKSIAGR